MVTYRMFGSPESKTIKTSEFIKLVDEEVKNKGNKS